MRGHIMREPMHRVYLSQVKAKNVHILFVITHKKDLQLVIVTQLTMKQATNYRKPQLNTQSTLLADWFLRI